MITSCALLIVALKILVVIMKWKYNLCFLFFYTYLVINVILTELLVIFCFDNGVILQDNVTNYLEVQTDVLRVNAPIYVIDY